MKCAKLLLLSAACLLTASATALAGSVADEELESKNLENWCLKPTAVTKISQLELLVSRLDQVKSCPERTKEALVKMKQLIDETKSQQCSMESVERYRNYYNQYLDTSSAEQKALNSELPAPLRTFALAYGMELSGLCRVNMVNVLLNDVRKVLPSKDFDLVEPLIEPMGAIASALRAGGKRPDDLLLPSDFIGATETSTVKKQMTLKIETTPIMKSLQLICKRRFEPVYGPLMLPVAKLANMGFEFRKKELKRALKEASRNYTTCQDVANWSRIVFMCEGMRQIQLVEKLKDQKNSEGNDATLVQVFDSEKEAEEAEKALNDGGRDVLAETQVKDEDKFLQLQFEPNLTVEMPDLVVKSIFSKQTLSLTWLNTNRDESARIKMRFFSRTFKKLTDDLKHLRFNDFFSFFFKEIVRNAKIVKAGGQVDESSITEDLVRIFNERVNDELNPELAVSDDFDLGACCSDDCCSACCSEECCCCCCNADCCSCGMPSICIWSTTTINNNNGGGYGGGGYGRGGGGGGYRRSNSFARRKKNRALGNICALLVLVAALTVLFVTVHAILAAG